ncbi:hypothetical protein N7528_007456 [Penicillium herquei]|nr:hypothetical protein N7528_007456 [Penicillium herquei]
MTVRQVSSQPDPAELSDLVSKITAAVSCYSQATGPSESEAALRDIQIASNLLSQRSMGPRRYLTGFHFQPHKILCVRIAIEMGLFNDLPLSATFTVNNLVEKHGTDREFTGRIVRALTAASIFEEVQEGVFVQTPLSREWSSQSMQSYTKHSWDNMTSSLTRCMDFFKERGFVSPSDPMNTPFAFARGAEDIDFFNLLSQDAPSIRVFNEAMASIKDPLGSMYDFGSLQPEGDGVVLVDVGGGKGQSIANVRSAYPELKGQWVLQDLPEVIAAGGRTCGKDVKVQPYDFFKQVQPVNGASAYLLKSVLHDWPDAECRTILRNLIPAMRGYNSKLLIVELVLPDFQPDAQKVLYDINMLLMSGRERSLKEWHALMQGTGLRIERIVGLDNPVRSVIEVILDE